MSQGTALLLSIAIEAAVAAGLVLAWRDLAIWRALLAAAIPSVSTHPIAWWGVGALEAHLPYGLAVAVVEAAVVLVEAVGWRLLTPLGWRRSLTASLVTNAVSAGVGLALHLA